MATGRHPIHGTHDHLHGPDCGHLGVVHGSHVDYLHDGHLHHPHGDHVDECVIPEDAAHPCACKPLATSAPGGDHVHGPGCGHPAVPHADHLDYLVDGTLHHPHDGHCDDHGPVKTVP